MRGSCIQSLSSDLFWSANKGWTDIVNWIKSQVSGAEVACEDGSLGVKGRAVDLLLSEQGYAEEIWACGPVPCLRRYVMHLKIRHVSWDPLNPEWLWYWRMSFLRNSNARWNA